MQRRRATYSCSFGGLDDLVQRAPVPRSCRQAELLLDKSIRKAALAILFAARDNKCCAVFGRQDIQIVRSRGQRKPQLWLYLTAKENDEAHRVRFRRELLERITAYN